MDIFDRPDLENLLRTQAQPCVSVFMPTERAGREVQQNPIRLKNLLRQAEHRLKELGVRSTENILKPGIDLVADGAFWRHQGDGLALFLAPNFAETYTLPTEFEGLTVVSDHFHLKPLLPMMSAGEQFYVLGLSQKYVKLFKGGRFSVGEVNLDGVPASLKDALKYDDREPSLQAHSGGRARAIFHGQGLGKDDPKDDIKRYFRLIDAGVHEILKGEQAPLVLAGVDYLLPLYREVTEYPHVMADGVVGSPEHVSTDQLHARAWDIVAPLFGKARTEAKARYLAVAETPSGTSDVKRAIRAAHQGRVDTLFVAVGKHLWGTWDPPTEAIHLHEQPEAGDIDLLDAAAAQAWLHGGTVHAVAPEEVPGEALLAAVLRY
ncbi:MAG: hypothetical protein KJO87_00845 [Acidimicrobiia bacterium]|nr:hypothetical protein [Acidimicrobiia bacterium]